jgi:type III pantothenate kinase
MIIVFDIGNTNIHLGYYKDNKLLRTEIYKTEIEIGKDLLKKILYKNEIEGVGISSVVPQLSEKLVKHLRREFNIKPLLIDAKIKMPVRIAYKNLGADRIANLNGAYLKYHSPILIFSFGTAITGDLVSREGIHLGGFIAPGIESQLSLLNQRTALVRNIKLKSPQNFFGRSTSECVSSGILYGIKFLVRGFIQEAKNTYRDGLKVIATGGWAKRMMRLIPELEIYDGEITLYGIFNLYKYNLNG